MSTKRLLAVLTLLTTVALAREADAEPATDIGVVPQQGTPNQPPPNMPPPGQYQPPPQYPQYQQQPQYQPQYQPQPQAQYQQPPYQQQPAQPPRRQPYHDGDPIPNGYHVEDTPRQGMVVGGFVLLAVPYGISALTAIAAKGDNSTNWLYAPVVGPWFLMGARNYGHCSGKDNNNGDESLKCVADVFVVTGLIVDGILQAGGLALILVGYLNSKEELVRDRAVHIAPTRVGSGYGLGLTSQF